MPSQTERKTATRAQLINASLRAFKQYGFEGVGVDKIAADAEVTSGAFYAHLLSKTKAFELCIKVGFDSSRHAISKLQQKNPSNWHSSFTEDCLNEASLDQPANTHAFLSLITDASRLKVESKMLFEEKFEELCEQIGAGLSAPSQTEKTSLARAYLAMLNGAYSTLKALPSGKTRDVTRASIRIAISELLD